MTENSALLPAEVSSQQVATLPPLPITAPAKPSAIHTVDLTKRYGSLTALDHLNLQLEPGDVFGFIGPNGAGKSTTMKILAGLLQPSSGEARILGKTVADNGDFVRRNVGYMPDSFGVYDDLKVSEYLEFFASAYHVPRKQRKQVVTDVLELTDLKYKQDAFVDSLSRGMQQRLGLRACWCMIPPSFCSTSQPAALIPARIEIRELLKELQGLGKTIMVSSHILSELGEFCNKLGIIERGKLLVVGTIDELIARARASSAIHLQVVGDVEPAVNLFARRPAYCEH